jgi:hypothetical protein
MENLAANAPALSSGQTEEAMRGLGRLKTRFSELVSAPDYRWSDDLPFVRVPKAALKNISSDVPAFGPKGRLSQWIKEVLNLSNDQQSAVVASLTQHLEAMDQLAAANATSTNWVATDGTYHHQVKVPPLGDVGQTLENNLATNLLTLLGPEQSQLVLSPFSSPNQWLSEEKVSHYLINEPGEFEMQVKPNNTDSPMVSLSWQYHLSTGGPVVQESMPTFLQNFFVPWLERNGLTRGVLISKP